jgi:outer membrane protein assembly factor BamB
MMMRATSALVMIFLAALAAVGQSPQSSAPGQFDWPQWQGPDRNAICRETGLMHRWPSDGPPLLWKTVGLGIGFTTPSIAQGRIFTMGNIDQDESVMALDEHNQGKLLWSTVIGPVRSNGKGYPGPRCTPTVDGNFIYALGLNGDLDCLEAATGKIHWHKDLVKDFGGRMMSGWGFSESPLVDGDTVICTPGGSSATLVALNKQTGDVVWKAGIPNAGGAGYSSIVIADVDGLKQYVQLLGKEVVGVDARDGRFLWKYARVANKVANIPTPIVHGNLIFCSTGYEAGSALLRLVRSGEDIKVEEVYFLSAKVLQNHHGGLVLVGDYIYGGHGHNRGEPICVKLENAEVTWKASPIGEGSAAVLYADGDLYLRYQNGVMALVEASPTAYKLVSRFNLPDNSGQPSWPHPVIAHGHLYIRDQDTLLCFDVKHH